MKMNKFALFVCLLFFSVSCVETLQDNTLRESNLISHSHDAEDDIARPVANATLTEEDGVIVQTGTDMKISQPMPIFPRDSSHIALGHPQQ